MKPSLVFGVSAGIAAFKVVDIVKKLNSHFDIDVILTKNAVKMIPPKEFSKVGAKINLNMFEKGFDYKKILTKRRVDHISLSDKADLIVIAPATADIIAKIANGIADDLLTTTILATLSKVIICPSMNVKMWQHPATKNNIKKCIELGHYIINPEFGDLACGYEGMGRLASNNVIKDEIKTFFTKRKLLKGKKILVTAGGTSEHIDPVRVITNESSGKTGICIAEEAAKYGAKVTLIKAHTSVEPNISMNIVPVKSAKDMFIAIKKHCNQDIIVHSAAVSDFTLPKNLKKLNSDKSLHLELTPATKILEKIKKMNKKVFLVGFKAEFNVSSKQLIKDANNKLTSSNADLIVANDVGKKGRGFGSDTNEVFIVDKEKKVVHVPLASKKVVAQRVIEEIVSKLF